MLQSLSENDETFQKISQFFGAQGKFTLPPTPRIGLHAFFYKQHFYKQH